MHAAPPLSTPLPPRARADRLLRYLAAVFAVLAAAMLRQGLVHYWGVTFVPFIFHFVAVTFAAWYGRLGGGILAVVVSAGASVWSLSAADPAILRDPPVALSLAIYIFAALGITAALESMHRSRDRAAEAEAQMKIARDDALAASRTKDAFLAMLSHELRTPLNPALLLASESASDATLPTGVRERFETIGRQISLEARLIDDLLDLNRLTLGTITVQMEAIDLHAVIRDAADTIMEDVSAKRMRLLLALDAGTSHVRGDPLRLRQVFWNVLKNAVKFSAPQSAVRIASTLQGGEIEVRITDAGIGMEAGELDRIFEAFVQAKQVAAQSHEYGGMGLGLAISKAVVDRHGGRIRAQSAGPGHGSVFILTLPVLPAAAVKPLAEVTATPDHARPVRRRVLLVEDHTATRQALTKLLERRGIEVTGAGSFGEAVAAAEETTYDLLVSDLGLPDRHGAELLGEIRRRLPNLPGIAVSGYGMDADRARSKQGGYSVHLVKPVTLSALEEAINQVLGASNQSPPATS